MKKYSIVLLVFIVAFKAFAAGPQCTTTVSTIRISNTGGLYLAADSISNKQYILLCSVGNSVNGVTTDTCKSWQSIIQTATASGQKISVSYKYANPDIASCDEVPVSNPPVPYFVQLVRD